MFAKKSTYFLSKIVIFSLFMVLFIDGLGISVTLPLFSDLFLIPEKSILALDSPDEVRNFIYGVSLASFSLGMFLASPVLGQLSDRLGRKKILIFSLCGTCMGYLISGAGIYIMNPWLFILGRLVDGLSAGSIPIAQAAILDVSTEENKAGNLGLILFAVTSGYILGPLCSDILVNTLDLNLIAPFLVTALLSLLSLLFLLPMKETITVSQQVRVNWLSAFDVLSIMGQIKGALPTFFAFLFLQLGWTMFFQYLPYLLTAIDKADLTANILAILGFGMALSFCFLTRFFQSLLKPGLGSLLSIILILLSFIFLFNASHLKYVCFVCYFVAALAYGLGYSFLIVLISQQVSNHMRGLVMGLTSSISALSSIITGLVGTVIINIHHFSILIFAMICMAGAILSLTLSNVVGKRRLNWSPSDEV